MVKKKTARTPLYTLCIGALYHPGQPDIQPQPEGYLTSQHYGLWIPSDAIEDITVIENFAHQGFRLQQENPFLWTAKVSVSSDGEIYSLPLVAQPMLSVSKSGETNSVENLFKKEVKRINVDHLTRKKLLEALEMQGRARGQITVRRLKIFVWGYYIQNVEMLSASLDISIVSGVLDFPSLYLSGYCAPFPSFRIWVEHPTGNASTFVERVVEEPHDWRAHSCMNRPISLIYQPLPSGLS